MLRHLSIRDVVLIDRLDLAFGDGLSVLTGETGAGKSILLDSLGLALGARGDAGLVRAGAPRATVSAEFALSGDHPALSLIAEQGLEAGDGALVLRRVIGADGRSRAFVNDQMTSLGLLRQLSHLLVDIHSQFDQHGLADAKNHLAALDQFAGLADDVAAIRSAYAAWQAAQAALTGAQQSLADQRARADSLRADVAELEALTPAAGEAAELEAERQLLQHTERVLDALRDGLQELDGDGGARTATQRSLRTLAGVAELAGGRLDGVLEALERADADLADAVATVNRIADVVEADPGRLDTVEQRLFALTAAARKHGVEVDALAAVAEDLGAALAGLDAAGDELTALTVARDDARRAYLAAARALSDQRTAAAARLDAAVAAELAPLKLDRARFVTVVEQVDAEKGGASGIDAVRFEAATNPGSAPGAIGKVASGGELSRFMLALKVVLADKDGTPTLVFDEVDAGIGGATAAAVGARLSHIAGGRQVLVVTHSPQVAALGAHHWRVAKKPLDKSMITEVAALSRGDRREEIARMLAGSRVTEEARAAADRLLERA